ncbi:hypothetical protein MJO28_013090 [Puccinia striiformis f. sp. tritici]|uniref:Uncharacterized protein n=1 Tax=Puccinia striiformis f. sp. tritici TaxID=168172 RepID=A0ACC0DYF1_9BASI|nr:hypothetical protein MJO28_013090 [Puccinia striiformis f. sp. tritici]
MEAPPFRSQASDEAGWFALVSSKHSECRNRPPLSMEFLMAFKRACLSGQSARRAQLQKIPSPRTSKSLFVTFATNRLNSSPPSIKVMPRPSSQSRRQRNSSLTSPLFHWRPRVSSPLTSEVTFPSLDEKWPISEKSVAGLTEELNITRRASNTQIGLSLVVDALMSVWLCRVIMDNFLTLRFLLAAIPPPFNQPGTILFCNSNHQYHNLRDYPVLASGQSAFSLKELPANCVLLPQLIVKIGQSQSLAGLIPLIVACAITLKLTFGYLLLRTSKRPNAAFTYFKSTAALHLLISYTTFVYIHVHIDLLMHQYPRLEQALRISSECIFFLAGVTVCFFLLAIVVVPLLWICSGYTHSTDMHLSNGTEKKSDNNTKHFNHHQQSTRNSRVVSPHKKHALSHKF